VLIGVCEGHLVPETEVLAFGLLDGLEPILEVDSIAVALLRGKVKGFPFVQITDTSSSAFIIVLRRTCITLI